MIEMVIALAIVGGVAGVIAGLFGVGGGMILVPAFYYAFTTLGYAHQDLMQICLATSLATIVVRYETFTFNARNFMMNKYNKTNPHLYLLD